MRKNKPGKTSGFSLIEVLVAITLSGTILAVLVSSFMQSAFTQQKIAGRLVATIIGAGKLAELEQGSEMGLSGNFLAPYQDYQWYATEENASDDSVMISLTVEWKEGGISTNVHQMSFKSFRLPKK